MIGECINAQILNPEMVCVPAQFSNLTMNGKHVGQPMAHSTTTEGADHKAGQNHPGLPLTKRKITCPKSNSLYRSIIDELAKESDIKREIDEASMQNMMEALACEGIDSPAQARKHKLKIIPPGPVFHNWVPLHGCGLFDGTNNPPYLIDLNYMESVIEEAEFLSHWDIPVFVVWSNNGMTATEREKMIALSGKHENLLTICLETELPDNEAVPFVKPETSGTTRVDQIRFAVCHSFPEVLQTAAQVAEKQGKRKFCERLAKLDNQSIIYTDFDNFWLDKPMFQLAVLGFSSGITIDGRGVASKKLFREMNRILERVLGCRRSKENRHLFLDQANSLYDLLYSKKPLKQLSLVNNVGYYSISRHALSVDIKAVKDDRVPGTRNAYQNASYNQWQSHMSNLCRRSPLQRLEFLQQCRQFHTGHDFSWLGETDRVNRLDSEYGGRVLHKFSIFEAPNSVRPDFAKAPKS